MQRALCLREQQLLLVVVLWSCPTEQQRLVRCTSKQDRCMASACSCGPCCCYVSCVQYHAWHMPIRGFGIVDLC